MQQNMITLKGLKFGTPVAMETAFKKFPQGCQLCTRLFYDQYDLVYQKQQKNICYQTKRGLAVFLWTMLVDSRCCLLKVICQLI